MLLVQEAAQEAAVARARELVDALPLVPNLLVHADLEPPLVERTRVFLGFAPTGELRAVATAYLGLGRPALAVATLPGEEWDDAAGRAILPHLRAGVDLPAMAIVDAAHEGAWTSAFKVRARHEEVQYLLRPSAPLAFPDEARVERVPASELPALDAFLRAYGATAWSRESFATGPYFWVRDAEGDILAAAGVHFETRFIGQVANVVVRETHRRKGLGRLVTSAVARRLRERGKIVSLFVKADNAGARRLYEKLGFVAVRRLVSLEVE